LALTASAQKRYAALPTAADRFDIPEFPSPSACKTERFWLRSQGSRRHKNHFPYGAGFEAQSLGGFNQKMIFEVWKKLLPTSTGQTLLNFSFRSHAVFMVYLV
jgi:hypothetical protein